MKARTPEEIVKSGKIASIPMLMSMIENLQRDLAKITTEHVKSDKMATSTMKDCVRFRIEIKRLNTRMISNENDVRHLNSKR